MQITRTCLSVLLALLWGSSIAAEIADGDPAIGGYYYFAALDKKCETSSSSREAALNQFKQHFIEFMRVQISGYPVSQTQKAQQIIVDLEKNGPAPEELKRYDRFFAKASRKDVLDACTSFEADVSQRIALETKLLNALRRP